jgi:hypothetical protein
MTEEDYDVHRVMSFFFQFGWGSYTFLHGILQTPSPRFDEHLTLRETKNRFVHKQIIIHEKGGFDMAGMTVKM